MTQVVNNDGTVNLESTVGLERKGKASPPRDSYNNILLSATASLKLEIGAVSTPLQKRRFDYVELAKAIDIEPIELVPKIDLEAEQLVPLSRVSDAEETIQELREQIDDLGHRLGVAISYAQGSVNISGLDALEFAQQALNNSTSGLVSSINSLSGDLASKQSEVAGLAGTAASLQGQVATLQGQNSGLQIQLASANATIASLQTQLAICKASGGGTTDPTITDTVVPTRPTDLIEPKPPITIIPTFPVEPGTGTGTTTTGGGGGGGGGGGDESLDDERRDDGDSMEFIQPYAE